MQRLTVRGFPALDGCYLIIREIETKEFLKALTFFRVLFFLDPAYTSQRALDSA